MGLTEEDLHLNHSRSSSPDLQQWEEPGTEASLRSVLNKIHEFRKDNRAQLSNIKQELQRANGRLDEAEGRIDETDNELLATSKRVKRLTLHQASLEARVIEHEVWSGTAAGGPRKRG